MFAPPCSARVKEELARVLASSGFKGSKRAARFLAYVVEQALAGRAEEIKEITIGAGAFGRAADYDPKEDAIVRSVARVVREKLNAYYVAEGLADAVRIELPKGAYVPTFREVSVETRRRVTSAGVAFAALMILVVLSGGGGRRSWNGEFSRAQMYERGREMWIAGEYAAARSLLEEAAARDPNNALTHSMLSEDLRTLGYNAEALEEARKAVTAPGKLEVTAELEVEAAYRSAVGDYQAAAASYAQLVEMHPERLEYRHEFIRALLSSGQYPECLRALAGMRGDPRVPYDDDAQLLTVEGRCLAGTGDYEGAIKPVQKAVAVSARRGARELYARDRLFEFGLLISTGKGSGTRPLLEEAQRICAEVNAESCLASAARIQGNTELWTRPTAAVREYDAALPVARRLGSDAEISQILNGKAMALEMLCDYAAANGQYLEAISAAKKADLNLAGIRVSMAGLAVTEGQLSRAIILGQQASRDAAAGNDKNTAADAQVVLAQAYTLQGDLEEAGVSLAEAGRLTAGLPTATKTGWALARATLSRLSGDLPAAAKQLEEVERVDDESVAVARSVTRIELLLDLGEYEAARRSAEAALATLANTERRSDIVRLQALLSDACGYGKQPERARKTAKAVRAALSFPVAPLSRIKALTSAGRWMERPGDRESSLRQAIELARATGFKLAQKEAEHALEREAAAGQIRSPAAYSTLPRSRSRSVSGRPRLREIEGDLTMAAPPVTFQESTIVAPVLYRVDTTTGIATLIGPTDLGIGGATSVNGVSYEFNDLTGQVATIDLSTGAAIPIGFFDPSAGVIQGAAATPEPASFLLAGFGIAGFAIGWRRSRSNQ